MVVPHRLIGLLLSLIISAFCPTYLQAQDFQTQEKVTIAVGEWPPYIAQDQKHNGVVSHIITDIFAELGIDASVQFYPWSRAYNETRDGLHAASAIWMDKEERKIDFIYSDPVLIEQFVFFHHKELLFNWKDVNDLKNFNIGGIYASSYGPELDQALTKGEIKLDRVNRPQQNFKKLLKKRIDLFPFEINVGNSVLKKYFSTKQRQKIVHHPKPLLNNSSFLLFPKTLKSSKDLSERFNRQLKIIKDNGKYDVYFKRLEQGYYEQSKQDNS
ncbi:MAG: transporter substrate-binding domain-containing protein [Oleispira antarctica]|nr:transporter substrate-binding domain-containing protein [Oleispira antarctica]MBQ0792907.1 transporter substrate-binding domain-containing protein [Oleispira antarctica]